MAMQESRFVHTPNYYYHQYKMTLCKVWFCGKSNKSLLLLILLILILLLIIIAAQNNAGRTNHNKVRIDKMQQNSKCRLYGDRDETINHIISECSKLVQKEYKTRHNWVGKVIHGDMCKKSNFDQQMVYTQPSTCPRK